MTQNVRENGSELTQDVKHLAGDAADQARKLAEDQITTRKDRAVTALGNVAMALRSTREQLESQNGHEVTQYVTRAADGIDRLSGYLKSRDLGGVVRDVEGFARREPAIFLGGAFVVGLVGSRFLRSSGAHPTPTERATPNGTPGERPQRPTNEATRSTERTLRSRASADETRPGAAFTPSTPTSSSTSGGSMTSAWDSTLPGGSSGAGSPGSGASGSGSSSSAPVAHPPRPGNRPQGGTQGKV